MMKNFNIMALRGKINDVAQRVWLRMSFFDQLFPTLCVMKRNMLSYFDIFQSLAADITKNIFTIAFIIEF